MGSRYSDEEAQEILKRALERDLASGEGIAHEELVEAAMEVGLAPEAVDRAAAEMRLELSAKQTIERHRKRRKTRFYRHFMTFAIVNSFLAAVDLLSGGGTWFYWPLLGWGMGIALQASRTFLPPTEEAAERALHREMARQQRLQAKEEEKRRKARIREQRRGAEKAFEDAVEQGVSSLLNALSKRISGPTPRPPSDFDNYVARRQAPRAPRAPAPAAPVPPAAPPAEKAPLVTAPPATESSIKARVEAADDPAEQELLETRAKHRRGRP